MFKKFITIATATLMFATGLAIVTAPSANAYASNIGAASAEVSYLVTVDGSGSFTVPAETKRASVFLNIALSNQNAATFANQTLSIGFDLKNPTGDVITKTIATSISPTARYSNFVSWNATQLNGNTPNTPVTLGANNTVLTAYVTASLETFDGTFLPTGSYQYELSFLKGGVAYTFGNGDTVTKNATVTLGGTSFTNPSNIQSSTGASLSVATCINRSLVTSSDTLTLHPSVTTTGAAPTVSTRIFHPAANLQSTLLSNTSTLALSGVDLTKPISVALTAVLETTANDVSSADLSVTRTDGTEVTQSCASATPAAPTVSFSSATTLNVTFAVISSIASPTCRLYLATDLNTVIQETGGPVLNSIATCNFFGRTAGVDYVVKVQESVSLYYSESQQQGVTFNFYRVFRSALSPASAVISTVTTPTVTTPTVTTPTLTAEQIAAAAVAAAKAAAEATAAVRAAEVAAAQTKLATVLKGDKAGTIDEYKSANVNITTAASLARINAEVLKLSANDRSDFAKIKAIADKIEFDESFFNTTARPTLTTYAKYEVVGITERILPTVNTKVLELPAALRVDAKAIQDLVKVERFVDQVANTETRGGIMSASLIERGLLPAETPYKHSVRSALASYPEGSLNSMAKIEAAIKAELEKAGARKAKTAEIKAKIAARNK